MTRPGRSFVLMLLPLWLASSHAGLAAEALRLSGPEIFRQLCAKCHGRTGEGVKGKYADALRGDWSIERLTRYIDRNMPENNPGKCKGEDAAAVARYIYDAFYSREARLRNKPARVELVRLTNRQYLNSVADLLKHFTGSDPDLGAERGLNAVYYDSRDFDGDKKVFEREDREVGFDFGTGKPATQFTNTSGFSIQWRGSLIAEETGEYEFILRTPNGARLWVNDEQEPLIDAWVASGIVTEHKAALRLIGGRVYPLQLNFFKFKEKTASVSLQWKPPHGAQQIIPARNLSPTRVSPTFVISTPFPADDSSVGYERGVGVSKAWDEAATQAAIEAANYVVQNLDHLAHTKPNDTNRIAKAQSFCHEFAATAFRRPLTRDQARLISAQFSGKLLRSAEFHFGANLSPVPKGPKRSSALRPGLAGALEDSVKRVVLLTLKSPHFLYLGLDSGKPDDFDVAARLSFGLWDSLPDPELSARAAQGGLRNCEQVAQQARRMLGDRRARSKMQAFFEHWLQMKHVEDLSKDDKLFPGFTPEIVADLRSSLNVFLDHVTWSDASDYRALLLADYLYVNNRLAQFYGMATNATDDLFEATPGSTERSGVLTHPYLLASFSYQKFSSPIHRGVFLTRNIMGRALKPPPMAQTFKDAEFAPDLTMREKVAQMTRPQACQTCHSVINPLGFSLEHFDAVGRFRTSDHDKPIDAVSDYTTADGRTIRLAGPRDVAAFAVNSEQAQNGFIEQLFHHVVKQPMAAYGRDVPERLRQLFVASGFNMQTLLVECAATAAMHGVAQPTF
ncbi:MAG: hypothetical protein C5B50_08985 [Verrucomicrobia bacterium]|nr:MAG: hypothetical protein C5B50_08985 [Verrucomicrobiota bacterium]